MMRSECTTEHLESSYTEADVKSWIDTLVGIPNQTIPIPLTMGDDLMGIEGHTILPLFRVGEGEGCDRAVN